MGSHFGPGLTQVTTMKACVTLRAMAALVVAAAAEGGDEGREARILALAIGGITSTYTDTSLTTSTTTVMTSCFISVKAAACGRRRKRRDADLAMEEIWAADLELADSLNNDPLESELEERRDGRQVVVTVWTSTTATYTATSTNTATTVSLSYYCSVADKVGLENSCAAGR